MWTGVRETEIERERQRGEDSKQLTAHRRRQRSWHDESLNRLASQMSRGCRPVEQASRLDRRHAGGVGRGGSLKFAAAVGGNSAGSATGRNGQQIQ